MAPARTHDPTTNNDDNDSADPVTAEYDIYLTPPHPEQIYLLQYPNRVRNRPYNARQGAAPDSIRIKPATGHLELDVNLNTAHNFNKYAGLKWGDAMGIGREVQNNTATYGLAAGFSAAKARSSGRVVVKDRADREHFIRTHLDVFAEAEREELVMHKQTLGGQIMRHDGQAEGAAGMPIYFVGAFRGEQLHLTKVDGTVQMRPQFHHLDAEEQRSRMATSRAAAGDTGGGEGGAAGGGRQGGDQQQQQQARSLLMKNKHTSEETSDKGRLEDRTRRALQQAEQEAWVELEYVDEDQEEAYGLFRERMFVRDVGAVPGLRSGMDGEQFLDAVSAPRRGSPTRRRKRAGRGRGGEGAGEEGDGDGEDEGEEGGGGAGVGAG
ncbi:hypothetical protein LTR36_010982 [Oleoguttula mirabilis]|uniref:Uncharacterized protein n=1 Tax=Oleoguttula mirabilis TaxID=1507867 RepID=A0AAV9J457_9PEZI|nr:hypothetical protein LTR36_010982 [Oleoguttula mirabilis]